MIGLWALAKYIAIFSFFAGILSALAFDVMMIFATPFSPEPYKVLAIDTGKVFLNSQGEIKVAINEMAESDSPEYRNFQMWRIAGASIVTLGLVVMIYKGLKMIVPSTGTDLGARLIAIVVALGIVYFISMATSIVIGEGVVFPFEGWYELAARREVIIDYILGRYSV